MSIVIGSLFSGYGGLDMAAESVLGDARLAWLADINPGASRILKHRYPDVPNLGDITAVDWTTVEPVDVLTGGFPCQDVSHAGKRAGLRPGTRSGGVAPDADRVGGDGPGVHGPGERRRAQPPHGGIAAANAARDGRDERRPEPTGVVGRPDAAERGAPAADAGGQRHGRGEDAGAVGRVDGPHAGEARERERARGVAGDRGATAAPDADGPAEPSAQWGPYGPAVARWATVLGRPAPSPTEPGKTGARLSPRFVEWMMGLPDGWVTDVPNLSRNDMLKALGNGVVPQQAAAALRILLAAARHP